MPLSQEILSKVWRSMRGALRLRKSVFLVRKSIFFDKEKTIMYNVCTENLFLIVDVKCSKLGVLL